jgi:MFS family permease
MSLGSIFNESYEYYRRSARRFTALAASMFALTSLLFAIADDAKHRNSLAVASVWQIVFTVATIVGSAWLQSALIVALEEDRNGRPQPSRAELYRRARPFLLPVLIVALGAALVAGLLSLLSLIAIPILVFLLTRWVICVPIVVVEEISLRKVFRRANDLLKGNFVNMLLLALLSFIILTVATLAGLALFAFLPRIPRTWLAMFLANTIAIPPVMVAWTVAYYQLARLRPAALV